MTEATLLTSQEVCDMLAVSRSTLLNMVRRGEIPHVRLKKSIIRYSKQEIEQWIQERRKEE